MWRITASSGPKCVVTTAFPGSDSACVMICCGCWLAYSWLRAARFMDGFLWLSGKACKKERQFSANPRANAVEQGRAGMLKRPPLSEEFIDEFCRLCEGDPRHSTPD